VKKEIDLGNPRYAASRKSSFMGGLINGRHTQNGYYTTSDPKKRELYENLLTENDE
jgi:hypothetical protein